jgi:prepilin-type N-terminal cleavage/methylation domain-containing protein
MRTRRDGTPNGWTLVELIMVMVIVGLLAIFVGPLLLNAVRAYDRTQTTVNTYGKMRYAMERMVRELSGIRRNPANTTQYDVAAMTATTFTFTNEDTPPTQVTITSGGGNLTLTYVGIAGGTLTDRVTAFSLTYYRHDGTVTANSTELEFVEISLTVSDGTTNYANRVRVALRGVQ